MDVFVQRIRALRIAEEHQLVHLLGEGMFGKSYLGKRCVGN